jgi:hypothetical protein
VLRLFRNTVTNAGDTVLKQQDFATYSYIDWQNNALAKTKIEQDFQFYRFVIKYNKILHIMKRMNIIFSL